MAATQQLFSNEPQVKVKKSRKVAPESFEDSEAPTYLPNGAEVGVDTSHMVRFDNERTKGWQLRFPAWHPTREGSIMFPDAKYHGPIGAFVACLTARGLYWEDLPLHPKGYTNNRRSSSGISGVNLNFAKHLKGASAFAWVACWMENGRQQKMRFSVGQHGFEEALDMAIRLREQMADITVSPEQRRDALKLVTHLSAWLTEQKVPNLKPKKHVTPVGLRPTTGWTYETPNWPSSVEGSVQKVDSTEESSANELVAAAH